MKAVYQVRKASAEDVAAVLGLIRELAIYEKAPQEVTLTEDELLLDAFGTNPIVEIIVAESDSGEILGAALFYEKYSTWKGRGMHLEDIVVKEAHRQLGIGSSLFEELMRIARDRNYARMDWQVLDWNEPALNFYRKYGAGISSEWLNGRFTREDLKKRK
jgi:ribosomal protein S18 acetylase RimI-like enzyme